MADGGESAQDVLSNAEFANNIETQLDWFYEDPARMVCVLICFQEQNIVCFYFVLGVYS